MLLLEYKQQDTIQNKTLKKKLTFDVYKIIDDIKEEFKLYDIKVRFKDIQRGRSSYTGHVSVPLWSINEGECYFLYYVVHELVHQIIYKEYDT